MKLGIHGTSYESATNIFKNGYQPQITNWILSNKNFCYAIEYSDDVYPRRELVEQAFRQGIQACIRQSVDIMPSIIILNLDGKKYDIDNSGTFNLEMNPIQIYSNIEASDVVGVYTVDRNLNHFRPFLLKNYIKNISSCSIDLGDNDIEFLNTLENFTFKTNSITRKLTSVVEYDIDLPDEIVI